MTARILRAKHWPHFSARTLLRLLQVAFLVRAFSTVKMQVGGFYSMVIMTTKIHSGKTVKTAKKATSAKP